MDREQEILAALIATGSRRKAAAMVGVDERTVYQYSKRTSFQTAYKAARREIVENATRRAQEALTPALDTLVTISRSTKSGASARVAAARSILEYGLKLTEQYDLSQRLDEIEEQLEGSNGYGKQ